MFNYVSISSNFLKALPERHKEVLSRRFGLDGRTERETLESIGRDYGVTRERVRQMERDGFLKLQPKVEKEKRVFQYFKDYFRKQGGLKREDLLLEDLGGERQQNQVYFLLSLARSFDRFAESEDFHPLWTADPKILDRARKLIASLEERLREKGQPIILKGSQSFLEASKKILQSPEGLYGLREWPEISPRGVKDKAYLVFKREKKPLHFREVASLIEGSLPQTVHNELIKDPRFVLVGRGLYALKEWGHEEGAVKDIIARILAEAGQPMPKEQIVSQVLKQRLVKENTVLLNLSNRDNFFRNSEGFYTINNKTA